MQDELMRWITAGVIGSIVKDILGVITLWVKLADNHIINIAADIFMGSPDIYRFKGFLFGFLVDLLIGGIIGMVVGMFLKQTGHSYYVFKGLFLGLIVWLLFIGFVMHTLPFVFSIVLTQFNELIYSMIAHIIYGMLTAYLIIRLDPKPIQE